MYFITTKRMLEVCFSVHPNIQYRTFLFSNTLQAYRKLLVRIRLRPGFPFSIIHEGCNRRTRPWVNRLFPM